MKTALFVLMLSSIQILHAQVNENAAEPVKRDNSSTKLEANQNYNPEFTLFDLYTDEPILPKNGYYSLYVININARPFEFKSYWLGTSTPEDNYFLKFSSQSNANLWMEDFKKKFYEGVASNNPTYTKYILKDTRNAIEANRYYRSPYTLFDLLTNKPLIPSYGYHSIYTLSPETNQIERVMKTPKDLENVTGYKFETEKNAQLYLEKIKQNISSSTSQIANNSTPQNAIQASQNSNQVAQKSNTTTQAPFKFTGTYQPINCTDIVDYSEKYLGKGVRFNGYYDKTKNPHRYNYQEYSAAYNKYVDKYKYYDTGLQIIDKDKEYPHTYKGTQYYSRRIDCTDGHFIILIPFDLPVPKVETAWLVIQGVMVSNQEITYNGGKYGNGTSVIVTQISRAQ